MARKKFNPEKHKEKLTALLIDIFKVLNGKIAFKGGTAAMIFYNLPRLSLALDFDVLDQLNDKDLARLQAVVEKSGRIKESREKRFTIFYLIDYERDAPNIKLEFNLRVWKNNSYKNEWLFGIPIQVADEITTFTNKLVALTNRKSSVARDVFDVYFFLKSGWALNDELIRERTSLTRREQILAVIECIETNFSDRNILAGVGELLDEKQKEWAKANLRKETIFLLKLKLENLSREID